MDRASTLVFICAVSIGAAIIYLSHGCKPASSARDAVACAESPPVQQCLKSWGCPGPVKQCQQALIAYAASCMELCELDGGFPPPCAVHDATWQGGECADAASLP
jgi:hypothetical protein